MINKLAKELLPGDIVVGRGKVISVCKIIGKDNLENVYDFILIEIEIPPFKYTPLQIIYPIETLVRVEDTSFDYEYDKNNLIDKILKWINLRI